MNASLPAETRDPAAAPPGNAPRSTAPLRMLHLIARWRWSLLLALLIAVFLLQPLAPASPPAQVAVVALTLLILGGAIRAAQPGPRVALAAAIVLAVALALEVLRLLGVARLAGPVAGLTFLIVLGAIVATFTELVRGRHSVRDTLVGAIFGYFLIAALWALLFRQLELWRPGSFHLMPGPVDAQFVYLSLVTITTVGYGDVLPATPIARIWAALEAAVGNLYIAILIGRIVGALRPPERRAGPDDDAP